MGQLHSGPAVLFLLPCLAQPLPFAMSEAEGIVMAGSPATHDSPSVKVPWLGGQSSLEMQSWRCPSGWP